MPPKRQNNKAQYHLPYNMCITIRVKWEQSHVWINVKLMNHRRFFLFIIIFSFFSCFSSFFFGWICIICEWNKWSDIWQHFCTRFPFSIVQCVDFFLFWSDWHVIDCVRSGLFPYPSCCYADFYDDLYDAANFEP